ELLNQLIGVNAEVNCDPTLLLKSSDWLKLTGQRKHKKPYILVYNVKNAEFDRLLSLAEKINSEKEMDIVMIPSVMAGKQLLGLPARRRGYTYLSTIGPDDYLTYFHDAEYVISDSFHGTVFSLLFHKPFFVLSRFSDGSANARANELLKLVGIQENDGTIENLDREIDWLAVDHKIAEMRKQGLSYLSHIETQINL
nr:polysaccharide pyruvyl transferase family protein [Clostridia bacterium]